MVGDQVNVKGLDELRAKFKELPRAMRVKVLRNSANAGMRVIRDIAKEGAPTLKPTKFKSPYRKAGTLRDAIRVRTSKRDRKAGDVGAFVNVKPLKKGEASAKNPRDPYYWRWQEFGWTPASKSSTKRTRRLSVKRGEARKIPGKRFLRDAAARIMEALPPFERGVVAWLAKVQATGKVTP